MSLKKINQEQLAVHYRAEAEKLRDVVGIVTRSRDGAEESSRKWQLTASVMFTILALSLILNIALWLVNQLPKP